jgi:hypothetical protein
LHAATLIGEWERIVDAQYRTYDVMYLVITLRLLYDIKVRLTKTPGSLAKEPSFSYDALVISEAAKTPESKQLVTWAVEVVENMDKRAS